MIALFHHPDSTYGYLYNHRIRVYALVIKHKREVQLRYIGAKE
jgi:hypothetical protein